MTWVVVFVCASLFVLAFGFGLMAYVQVRWDQRPSSPGLAVALTHGASGLFALAATNLVARRSTRPLRTTLAVAILAPLLFAAARWLDRRSLLDGLLLASLFYAGSILYWGTLQQRARAS